MKRILIIFIVSAIVFSNLNAQLKELSILDNGHNITSAVFSPDGKYTATAGLDKNIIVRDAQGRIYKRLEGLKKYPKTIAFSSNSEFLVAGGEDKNVTVWSLTGGVIRYTLEGHKDIIKSVAASSKGIIASASGDKTIRLWSLQSGQLFQTLTSHTEGVNSVCFSQDGKFLASGGYDKTVKIWDGETGALLLDIKDTEKGADNILAVAFSPDGKLVASAGTGNKIQVWNSSNGLKVISIDEKSGLNSIKISPDNNYIIGGGVNKTVSLWNLKTGALLFQTEKFSDAIYAVDFSPDGDQIIIADYTKELHFWDAKPLNIAENLLQNGSIKQNASQENSVQTVKSPSSDVDKNIPENNKVYSERYALIIGNEDYSSYQTGLESESNVDFAEYDATVFREYAIHTLGIPEKNIIFLINAKAVEMHRSIEKLSLLSELSNGEAELFVYYAGHGFPDEVTHDPYLIPVDVSGSDLRFAVSLKDFYARLTEFPVKRVTVFIDACFSGGARNQGLLTARAVKVKPKENTISGNFIVFTASSGEESSLPYKEKEHGMFTYLLLKKLQDSKGSCSYEELADYLKKEVGKNSILINNKPQTPQVNISPAIIDEWKNWTFK